MDCTYQLRIKLAAPLSLQVGRLGLFLLPAGDYVYTGSARRSLPARLARHCSSAKRLRWHIDYLLSASGVSIEDIRTFNAPECEVNFRTEGEIPVAGFGASDCRAGCGSHLKYLGPREPVLGGRPDGEPGS